jgi:malonyl-CoA decarboxylase
VQRLLDEKAPVLDPKEADTAIFYSINNCQRGLDGISFGNFLIKRVVELLSAEFSNLKTFATLSPIPGYVRWLDQKLEAGDGSILTEEEAAALRGAAPGDPALPAPATDGATVAPPERAGAETPAETLRRVLGRRHWIRDEKVAKLLEPILIRACARYLLAENATGSARRARDPVAHFHLSNGARVERLNWRADTSDKGFRESRGLMVNYLYDPTRIEENHEAYVGDGKRPAASALRRLAKGFV